MIRMRMFSRGVGDGRDLTFVFFDGGRSPLVEKVVVSDHSRRSRLARDEVNPAVHPPRVH